MTDTATFTTASALAFGFVLGVKHAMEVDHLAAVSTIVSERKSLFGSVLVGGLWGVGHTITLLIAGLVVILLHVEIGPRLSLALEFCVGLMLVVLGLNAIRKLRHGGKIHLHAHQHGGRSHVHPHIHDGSPESDAQSHHGFHPGVRPLVVGMIHGLAGSAALMILVLSTISSPAAGIAYIAIFGVGSVGGMMLMSALVSLPVYFTATRFNRANFALRCVAGVFSLGFGLYMMYEIGYVGNLFR